jgi:uncharacterized membrane protein YfcA
MGLLGILLLALVSGLLIGCIGVGGVLLVPTLSLAGVSVHVAVAASMAAFVFSGAIGTWLYARRGSIDWRSAGWVSLGAAPAAFLGAIAGNRASGTLLTALIGLTVIFAGVRALRRDGKAGAARWRALAPLSLALIGAGVGFASAITGTGGPLLLVPLLIWLDLPILAVVGLSQAAQVPIALMATAGNLVDGVFDIMLVALLSGGVIVGSWAGARVAHALPTVFLTRLVGVVLLAVGALLIFRSYRLVVAA